MAKHKRWTKAKSKRRPDASPPAGSAPAPRAEAVSRYPAEDPKAAFGSSWVNAKLLAPWLLIAAALAAYHNSFTGPFIFDDYNSITNNPYIRKLWPLADALSWPKLSTVAGRPVVALSLAINYAFGQFNVWGYHAFNLAIHILAGLVLFGVVRRTLMTERLGGRHSRQAPWLALAVALIWLVHPLLTESVSYVIQRTELLMGLFMLLTLYCVIRGASSSHRASWYAAGVVACALGMASKEVMVVAPLIVLLYDRAFLSKSFSDAFRRRWGLYVGLAGTWLIVERLLATGAHSEVFVTSLTPWEYASTEAGVIVHYLRLSVWAHPLVLDYDDWPVARTAAEVLPAAAVVLALLGATLWAARRQPWLGFLGAWFFLILAPTSSVLPLAAEVAAERRMYLPLAAVVVLLVVAGHVALGWVFCHLRSGDTLRGYAEACLVIALVGTLGYVTMGRNEDYRTLVSIWSDVVAKRPNNARAHNNLGTAFHLVGQLEPARIHYAEAVRIKPKDAPAQTNLGVVLVKQGKLEEGLAHFSEALAAPADPAKHANARKQLGWALARNGRLEEAIASYEEALRLTPNDADMHTSLADALRRRGRLEEAAAYYSQSLRLRPNQAGTHFSLGQTLALQGKIEDAARHFEAAVRLEPNHARARSALADLRSGITRATP